MLCSYIQSQASVKAFRNIKKASHCIWAFIEKLKISDRVYVATELVASFKDAMFDIVDIGKTTWLC